MPMLRRHTPAIALTIAVAALYWIDPLFLPLALLGPLVTGAIAGRRGLAVPIALAWAAAGLLTLVLDVLINSEDAVFHLVLAAFTGVLALGAGAVSARIRRGAPAT